MTSHERVVHAIALATALASCTPMPSGSDAGAGPVGYILGPVGSQIDVDIGTESTTARITASDVPATALPTAYFHAPFTLPSSLDATSAYEITLGAAQPNQTCRVYMGAMGIGSALTPAGSIRVGCEWTYDLASRATDDTVYDGSVRAVAIGGANVAIGNAEPMGDGRYVVVRNGYDQLAWRDRFTGITRIITHAPDGSAADGNSAAPAISANGQWVIFQSDATNLVAGDTNHTADIFLWSAMDDSVVRVSVGPAGEEADGPSDIPTISGDGHVIAFMTNATTIVPTPTDGTTTRKIVRIDRTTGERIVVSRNMTSGNPSEGSSPMLSEDGTRLVFQTFRDVTGDINTYAWDIFVYDHGTHETWPVTLTSSGAAHDGHGSCASCGTAPAISGDGHWVAFADGSTNLDPAVHDSALHYWLVEVDACSPTLGRCHIVPIDIAADGTPGDTAVTGDAPSLSYDGRYVSFASAATNLGVAPAMYPQNNVYLYDRDGTANDTRLRAITSLTESSSGVGTYTALSRGAAYVAFRADGHLDPRFDAAGGYVAFTGVADGFTWTRGPVN